MSLRTAVAALMLLILGSGLAHAERVVISIDKNTQNMTVIVDGLERYDWPVSTGAAGYTTPSGTYQPFRMEEEHFSKEWDDAPMPNSIFFTPRGHAIHGSRHVSMLGRRASHGCVRLAPEQAAALYSLVQEAGMANTTVIVSGGGEAETTGRHRGRRWMQSPDWMPDNSEGY